MTTQKVTLQELEQSLKFTQEDVNRMMRSLKELVSEVRALKDSYKNLEYRFVFSDYIPDAPSSSLKSTGNNSVSFVPRTESEITYQKTPVYSQHDLDSAVRQFAISELKEVLKRGNAQGMNSPFNFQREIKRSIAELEIHD